MAASIPQLSKELKEFFEDSKTPELTPEQIKDIARWTANKIDQATSNFYSKGYSAARSDMVNYLNNLD